MIFLRNALVMKSLLARHLRRYYALIIEQVIYEIINFTHEAKIAPAVCLMPPVNRRQRRRADGKSSKADSVAVAVG